ncbi:FKBP-type peptidyl-prolyl cis-trans isomerase [Paradesertivirga mongoliensis]|uniref:Peptidyl-prolyl cis-trans isomerase n=1 Tax=Paradesertivirga mongoliensis TaxID=2100740 RepID=A0ABW4ZKW1_9SPHI|nr:FKBP-type peptidyl-prolyl cis-trans isomerase [Pedobacter mongoliensis]
MNLNLYKPFYLVTALLLIIVGCKKDYASIEEIDEANINAYLAQNNISAKKAPNGVYFIPGNNRGSGAEVQYTEKIPLLYTIRSLDGQYSNIDTFVNRYGAAGQFLGYLSPEGLRTAVKDSLKRGGQMRIIIPSHLAYGRDGSGPIPGNASLEYTVRMLNENDLPAYDDISIEKYKSANGLTDFSKTPEGIHFKVITPGTGSSVTVDSTISVQYIGKLFNGKVFEETSGTSQAAFTLSQTIPGWTKTLTKIKEGGKIRILIPSAYAYGINGSKDFYGNYTIPPFSCLDFEVTIKDVQGN